ncbi:MAG: hypothetical protein ACKVRO_04775 [Micropepsaceae bacterium]
MSSQGLAALWIGVSVISVAAVAVAPIAAFVLMISAFGLPHVLYELRYVDERFSARMSPAPLAAIGALIALIAAARIANGLHLVMGNLFLWIELGLGAALALTATALMRQNKPLGALIGAAFALGAVFAPIPTFLVWAWLHNLTPLGFVAEITEGEERRRWLLMLSIPFFVLPALVATGVFHDLANLLFRVAELQWTSMFGAGYKPLLSFLPPDSWDLNLFSAAVVAQSMHYVAVIVLLPRLLRAKQGTPVQTIVPWPSWPVFAAAVAAIAAVAFGIYAVSYTDARAAYGVAAAIHAWIELPILLLAIGQGFTSARK